MQKITNPNDATQTMTRYIQTVGVDILDIDDSIFKHPLSCCPRTLVVARFPDFINDKDQHFFEDPYYVQCTRGKSTRQHIEDRK